MALTKLGRQNFDALNEGLETLKKVTLFPALTWLWVWDVLVYMLGKPGEDVFMALLDDCDKLGISIDLGEEVITETLQEWAIERGFMKGDDE